MSNLLPLSKSRRRRIGFQTFLLVLTSLLALPPLNGTHAQDADTDQPHWRPLFRGIDYADRLERQPRPLALHAVRIDLTEPGISFLATPSNGERPEETDGLKTSTFLKQHKCQLAINASPFSPVEEGEGNPRDILGLGISQGQPYSPPHSSYGALLISKDNTAWIAEPPIDASNAHNAVSGFHLLLRDGVNVGDTGERHPRTAVGISEDQRFLYFLVIDGRQRGYSVGASTSETADRIKWVGAYNALNLDGGGSTALVIQNGPSGAKILNRPIHNHVPGTERVVGNHLGVFAAPVETQQAEPEPDRGDKRENRE